MKWKNGKIKKQLKYKLKREFFEHWNFSKKISTEKLKKSKKNKFMLNNCANNKKYEANSLKFKITEIFSSMRILTKMFD